MFTAPTLDEIPTPAQMVAAMDRTVAGLDIVKRRLAWTLHRHQTSAVLGRDWRPANILVLGHSGTGKTHILKALLRSCKIIWGEATITEYSDVGFAGRNLASMYLPLFQRKWLGEMPTDEAGEVHPEEEQIELVQRFGVVILDEFDKIRSNAKTALMDRQGGKAFAMQAELLKMAEGTEVKVKETDDDEGFYLDTSHILHIACGAFQGLTDQMAKYHGQDNPNWHEKAEIADITQYGFMEELVGRFSSIVPLPALKVADFVRILTEQVIPEYTAELEDMGIELVFTDSGIATMSQLCSQSEVGARSIRPEIDKVIWSSWLEAKNGDRLTIDAEAIKTKKAHLESPVTA